MTGAGGGAATTAVCFDVDGTLLQYDRSHDAVTAGALADHLETATDDAVRAYTDAFLSAFEKLAPDPYREGMGAALDHAAASSAFDGAAVADTSVDELVATRREREYAAASVPPAARDCLADLAADDGTRVVVVTDGVSEWQRDKLAHHGLLDPVEAVVVSYEVGGHKAGGDPYDAVRDRVPADEYVMVGDSYESDVEAARAAGFVPVRYEDDGTADFFAVLRALW